MLASQDKCTGCMACFNTCQHDAIKIVVDKEGFERPSLNRMVCKKCGKCEKSCHVLQPTEKEKKNILKVYAGVHSDETILLKSSSGGVFTALAQKILQMGGAVYGAALSDRLNVEHIMVEQETDIKKLRQSKYVQSAILNNLSCVKKHLERGRFVLFSGLPCQVAGLYSYLGKEYENLFTIDILCKGVPSPGVFNTYINSLKKKFKCEIKGISFRDKKYGWGRAISVVTLKDDKEIIKPLTQTSFGSGFSTELFFRKSCYSCSFRNLNRYGDISLGDFWGIGKESKFFNNRSNGISLILLNSQKGKSLFEMVAGNTVFYEEHRIEDIMKTSSALKNRINKNSFRKIFFTIYKKYPDLALEMFTLKHRMMVVIRDKFESIKKH